MSCSKKELEEALRESEMPYPAKIRIINGEAVIGLTRCPECKNPYIPNPVFNWDELDRHCENDCENYPLNFRILSDQQRELYRGNNHK